MGERRKNAAEGSRALSIVPGVWTCSDGHGTASGGFRIVTGDFLPLSEFSEF